MSVEAATKTFLDSVDLDEAGETRAQIALALARKLDQAADVKASAGLAAASAGIAKELRDTLAELEAMKGEAEQFVGDLFAVPKGA